MNRAFDRYWAAAGLLCCAVLVGCGDAAGSLAGNVTLDGQPLAVGQIAVEPKDGQGTPAGESIKDGKYAISDLKPGDYLVRINASKVTGSRPAYGNDPNGPKIEESVSIVDAKYNVNTTLTVTVKAGKNSADFATTGQ